MAPSTFLWLLLGLALLIPGHPLWKALYLAGGIYLLARFSLRHATRRLSVERQLSDQRIFLGESLTITLRFQNTTGVPLSWLQFWESRPQPMASEPLAGVISLVARGREEVSYTLHSSRRGRYSVGPLRLITGDPFGFARIEGEAVGPTVFTVYPRVVPLPGLGLPARLPTGDLASRRRLFEDPAWLTGTREYAPGDSMKRIHWNATARTGELVVKQFRHAMLLPCCIALNLNRADYAPRGFWLESETAITAAASLAAHLTEQKQQVAMMAMGRDPDEADGGGPIRLPLRQGRAALVEGLEVLARIEAAEEGDFAALVMEEARRMPWGTLLCIVTPRETPSVALCCARIARGGQQVLLFVTDDADQAAGRRSGYQVYRLSEQRSGGVLLG